MSTPTTMELVRRPASSAAPARWLAPRRQAAGPKMDSFREGPARDEHESPGGGAGHDFARIAVRATDADRIEPVKTGACPLRTSPRACPLGGACHECPARVQAKRPGVSPADLHEQAAERAAEAVASRATRVPAQPGTAAEATKGVALAVQEALRSPGEPLDRATRAFMEPRLGFDFGGVRVHHGPVAAAACGALNALAFTSGRDAVFGENQYEPERPASRHLLAHELAHVVQQSHGPAGLQRLGPASEPADPLEREAAAAAAQVLAGGTARLSGRAPVGRVQCEGETSSTSAPATPATPRPLREERFGVGRGGGRVDAELNRSNCWLTLRMKVRFNFVNTPEAWPSTADQTSWQTRFIRAVMDRWSFRYRLVPDRECAEEPCRVAYGRIQVIPVTSNPHFTLTVGYSASFRTSSVSGRTATLDALDVAQRADIPQTPAEHEFGHMLGLPHIRCPRNDDECYGVTAEEQADIMGLGSHVSARDWMPFAEVMYYFNGCNWHPTLEMPAPRRPEGGGS